MNSEGGDAQEGSVYAHKLRREVAVLIGDDNSSGQGEVAVEPGVPDTATVGLNANLEISDLVLLGHRPDLLVADSISIRSLALDRPGLTRRLGLSMCVATIETPAPGDQSCGMVNASSALWLLLRHVEYLASQVTRAEQRRTE